MTEQWIAQQLANIADLLAHGQFSGAYAPKLAEALGFTKAMHEQIVNRLTPQKDEGKAEPAATGAP